MAAPNKPGVDWVAIRAEYESGAGPSELARRHPVTKQSIAERAKREGWNAKPRAVARLTERAARNLPVSLHSGKLVNVKTPEAVTEVLERLADGMGRAEAAALAGVSPRTLQRWVADDPDFAELCALAERLGSASDLACIKGAASRGDWKAAAFLLERRFRDEWGAGNQPGQGGIRVVINVGRDPPELQGRVIDATSHDDGGAREDEGR